MVKTPAVNAGDIRDLGLIPGLGRSPKGDTATHFNVLAWKIPWTEKPGGLRSIGSQRVGHNSDLAHVERGLLEKEPLDFTTPQ